jgi:hypothetical protein
MQKWEYLYIDYDPKKESLTDIRGKIVLSAELIQELAVLDQAQLSNRLGEDGWELVSNNPIIEPIPWHVSVYKMVFKRPTS